MQQLSKHRLKFICIYFLPYDHPYKMKSIFQKLGPKSSINTKKEEEEKKGKKQCHHIRLNLPSIGYGERTLV